MANTRIDACKYLVDTTHPDYMLISVAFVSDEPEHFLWGAGVKTQQFPAAGAEWEPLFKDALAGMSYLHWPDADQATTALLSQGLTIPGTQTQLPPDYILQKQLLRGYYNQHPGLCTCGVPYVLHGRGGCGWSHVELILPGNVPAAETPAQKREQAITRGLVSETGSLGHPGNRHSIAAEQTPALPPANDDV